MEVLQILLYFIVVWHLSRKFKAFKSKIEENNMLISDYTIQVGVESTKRYDQGEIISFLQTLPLTHPNPNDAGV